MPGRITTVYVAPPEPVFESVALMALLYAAGVLIGACVIGLVVSLLEERARRRKP